MVDELDKKELAKLSPEQRIKKLQELNEKRRKEREEADKIIHDSIQELERDRIAERIQAPEPEQVDLAKLFEEQSIDQRVQEKPRDDIAEKIKDNVSYISNLYEELGGIREAAQQGAYLDRQRAADIYERIMGTGYQSQDEAAKNIAEGSRRLIKEIFGEYAAKQDYKI